MIEAIPKAIPKTIPKAIPKIIHRIWLGPNPMPQEQVEFGKKFMELHPGWTHYLWTEKSAINMVNQKYYNDSITYSQKSNIIRYEALLKHGGVYFDTDVEPIKNIEPLLNVSAFCAWELTCRVGSAILGCIPEHPWMQNCINLVPYLWKPDNSDCNIGPPLVTTAVGTRTDVTVYSSELFYPFSWTQKELSTNYFPLAYTKHHWNLSWKK